MTDDDDCQILPFQTEDEMPENPRKNSVDRLKDRLREKGILRDINLKDMKKQIKNCLHEECKNQTNRPSGFCQDCEKRLGPYLNTEVLRCSNCMARQSCPEGQNKYGVCVYETEVDKEKYKQKDSIEHEMREILHRDKKIVDRLSRILPAFNLNDEAERKEFTQMSKELKLWHQVIMEHYKIFATFKGWTQSDRSDVELMKIRLKALDKVFGRGVRSKGMKQTSQVEELGEDELSPLLVEVPPGEAFRTKKSGTKPISDRLDDVLSDYDDMDSLDSLEADIVAGDIDKDRDVMELEELEAEYHTMKDKKATYDINWSSENSISNADSNKELEQDLPGISNRNPKGRSRR